MVSGVMVSSEMVELVVAKLIVSDVMIKFDISSGYIITKYIVSDDTTMW